MSKLDLLTKKINVRWGSRLIVISGRVSFLDLHMAIKSSFSYHSKFQIPMLNHSSYYREIRKGAPELKRLILDAGWQILGEENIYDSNVRENVYRNEQGEIVKHLVVAPNVAQPSPMAA